MPNTVGATLPQVTFLIAPGTDAAWVVNYKTPTGEAIAGVIEMTIGTLTLTGALSDGATTVTLPRASNNALVGWPVHMTHIAPGGLRTPLARGSVRNA